MLPSLESPFNEIIVNLKNESTTGLNEDIYEFIYHNGLRKDEDNILLITLNIGNKVITRDIKEFLNKINYFPNLQPQVYLTKDHIKYIEDNPSTIDFLNRFHVRTIIPFSEESHEYPDEFLSIEKLGITPEYNFLLDEKLKKYLLDYDKKYSSIHNYSLYYDCKAGFKTFDHLQGKSDYDINSITSKVKDLLQKYFTNTMDNYFDICMVKCLLDNLDQYYSTDTYSSTLYLNPCNGLLDGNSTIYHPIQQILSQVNAQEDYKYNTVRSAIYEATKDWIIEKTKGIN